MLISYPRKDGNGAPAAAGVSPAPGGIKLDSVPANLFATALARNQTPINSEANRTGASFDTMLRPIGERLNSPMVCNIYNEINHHMLILV